MSFKLVLTVFCLFGLVRCNYYNNSFHDEPADGKYTAFTDCDDAEEKSGEVTFTTDHTEVNNTCGEIDDTVDQRQFLVVNGAKFGLNDDCYRYSDYLGDVFSGIRNEEGRRCDFVGYRYSRETKGIFLCYYGEKERLCTVSLR